MAKENLLDIYNILLEKFSRQGWWPVISRNKQDNQFEICLGAILTQNTSWQNVEKALHNLNDAGFLDEKGLRNLEINKLAQLIKPAGYYNKKAEKIKAFLSFLEKYPLNELESMPLKKARKLLLDVRGIGKETADSILLYALNKPVFVVDAYTKRSFSRIVKQDFKDYDELQRFFMNNLQHNTDLFNEYHALIVELGKRHCRKHQICGGCVLNHICKSS